MRSAGAETAAVTEAAPGIGTGGGRQGLAAGDALQACLREAGVAKRRAERIARRGELAAKALMQAFLAVLAGGVPEGLSAKGRR